MNIFRAGMKDGSLNRKLIRVCAVSRLLKKKRISESRAIDLLAERHSAKEMKILRGTVALWRVAHLHNSQAA